MSVPAITTAAPTSAAPRGGRGARGGWKIALLAMAAAALVAAVPAWAQAGLALEVRGGASAGSYGGAASRFDLAPRPSLGATVSWGLDERLGAYAGFGRSAFACETGFCAGRAVTFTSRGVEAGVQARLPLPAAPWVRAGVVRHALRYDARPGDGDPLEGEETRGVGISAGAGVELRLGRRLSVTPGVRYLRYGAAGDDGVALLVGDVGLRIRM